MAKEEKPNRREQVKKLIETGNYTKKEIAEEIGVNGASVSSQMTYLRWMGNFIITDKETKKLSFVSEEEYEKWEAEKAANKKTKSKSTRTPEEQLAAYTKTKANQEKALTRWEDKLQLLENDKSSDPDDITEARAQVDLHTVKIKRNATKIEDLAAAVEVTEEDEDVSMEDEELV